MRWAALAAAALILMAASTRFAQPDPFRVAASKPPAATQTNRLVYTAQPASTILLPDGGRREVRSLLKVARPLHYGDYIWDVADVPAGPVWVRVDLHNQTMSVFRAGHEIGAAVILYGTDGKPTPTGVFPVLEKARHHRSSLYDAEMPYMLRLTGDGVAIHASNVREGAATHGCIGIPEPFARLLFAQIRRRDQIVIT